MLLMHAIIVIGLVLLIMGILVVFIMRTLHSIRSMHGGQNGTAASRRRPPGALSAIHWIVALLLRVGIRVSILGPMMLLTVRGRKTGKLRSIPVDFWVYEDRHFLIATHGEGNWVRNLRAAGEGSLSLGWTHRVFTARELSPEIGGSIIKAVLLPVLASSGIRGSMLRRHLGVTPDSTLDDFINVARSHPVFELDFPRKPLSRRELIAERARTEESMK